MTTNPDPGLDPLTESRRVGCDEPGCTEQMRFRLYASYNADQGENTHPLHARYPGVMYRSCEAHVGALASGDIAKPFSTRQWIVVAVGDTDA